MKVFEDGVMEVEFDDGVVEFYKTDSTGAIVKRYNVSLSISDIHIRNLTFSHLPNQELTLYGQIHRESGPAIISNTHEAYWWEGKTIFVFKKEQDS